MSHNQQLPQTGFLRLSSIIAPHGPIPVSKSTWWAGVKAGQLELDGARFDSPSPAAVHAAGGGSYNGWVVWKDSKGRTLADIHQQYADTR